MRKLSKIRVTIHVASAQSSNARMCVRLSRNTQMWYTNATYMPLKCYKYTNVTSSGTQMYKYTNATHVAHKCYIISHTHVQIPKCYMRGAQMLPVHKCGFGPTGPFMGRKKGPSKAQVNLFTRMKPLWQPCDWV